jgi:hypothetical protein
MIREDPFQGFISKLSPPQLGFWLASAAPAFLLLVILTTLDVFPVLQVWRHHGLTRGKITDIQCGERQRITFQYQVANRVYTRRGRFSDVGLKCLDVSVGMPIYVTFDTKNPSVAVATSNPALALKRRIRALAISMAVAYLGTMLALWVGARFGPLLFGSGPSRAA